MIEDDSDSGSDSEGEISNSRQIDDGFLIKLDNDHTYKIHCEEWITS